jgi:hypothetical protein
LQHRQNVTPLGHALDTAIIGQLGPRHLRDLVPAAAGQQQQLVDRAEMPIDLVGRLPQAAAKLSNWPTMGVCRLSARNW